MFWSMWMNGIKCLLNAIMCWMNVIVQVCVVEWSLMNMKEGCVKCNDWESNQ